METWKLILLIIAIVIGSIIISYFLITPIIAKKIYKHFFVRESYWVHDRMTPFYKEKVDHVFYDEGVNFIKKHQDKVKELEIVNDGLKLCGTYIDFGREQTVIINPGRKGTTHFAMYHGQIYEDSPYNILAIDPRSNGFSEGTYLTAGIKESYDLIKWSEYLHDELHQKAIFVHGICIGGVTAMLACTRPNAPSYIIGIIAEGPFYNFKKMFQNHVHDSKGVAFPVDLFMTMYFKKYAHVDMIKESPYNCAPLLDRPILIFQSKNDKFAIPKQTKIVYDRIKSKDKKIIYVEDSTHSHIMYFYRDLYTKESLKFSREVLNAYENKTLQNN